MVNLDKVPKKYEGLDGTEIAISESQERMAVVVDPSDLDQFWITPKENLEAVRWPSSPREPRLVLEWKGKEDRKSPVPSWTPTAPHQRPPWMWMPSEKDIFENRKRCSRCPSQMAGYAERPERLLPEGSGGNVRLPSVPLPYCRPAANIRPQRPRAMVAKLPVLKGKAIPSP